MDGHYDSIPKLFREEGEKAKDVKRKVGVFFRGSPLTDHRISFHDRSFWIRCLVMEERQEFRQTVDSQSCICM
jgi:hypothetical protein